MLVSLEKIAEMYLALRAVLPDLPPRVVFELDDDAASNMQFAMDGTLPGAKVPRDLQFDCCDFFEGPTRIIRWHFDLIQIHIIEGLTAGPIPGVGGPPEGLLIQQFQEKVDLLCTPVSDALDEDDIRAGFGPMGPSAAALVMCANEIAVIANSATEGGQLQGRLREMAVQVNEAAIRRLAPDDEPTAA